MESEKQYSNAKPFFSVIVPCFNREGFIARTLQSIQNQLFENYEVIVVDDCSTDSTVAEVKPFLRDERFRLIQNAENLERSKSRNIGMKNARGLYLTLLDSDDLMYPCCLKDAYEYASLNPEMRFFRNFYDIRNAGGRVIKEHKEVFRNYKKALSQGNFLSCIGVFIEKEIFSAFFFDEDERVIRSEDWEFWLQILAYYKLGTIPKINSSYTYHSQRSMEMVDPKEIEMRKFLIINKMLDDPHTKSVYEKYEMDMKASALIFVAVQSNAAGLSKTAFCYLKKAWSISPLKTIRFRTLVVLKNAFQGLFLLIACLFTPYLFI